MGVQYDVYEVDLREDAHSLQLGLKEVTKHATVSHVLRRYRGMDTG